MAVKVFDASALLFGEAAVMMPCISGCAWAKIFAMWDRRLK
jgi:hypothetical protein